MPSKSESQVVVRVATPEDSSFCGQICYDAFSKISANHGFPCDLPGPEAATGLLALLFSSPGFYCVVAESSGRIVGSNCLDERSMIAGIGPITVDPGAQNLGVGRKLMQVVMDGRESVILRECGWCRPHSTTAHSRFTPPSASTFASLSLASKAGPSTGMFQAAR